MTCDICGCKKDVKAFYGVIKGMWYKECRSCFDKIMDNAGVSAEGKEKEWNRGKKSLVSSGVSV